MTTEVRWFIQVSLPSFNQWKDTEDTYSGWFYGDGNEGPSESLLRDWNEAVAKYTWLDVRLVKETRSHSRDVLNVVRRNDE